MLGGFVFGFSSYMVAPDARSLLNLYPDFPDSARGGSCCAMVRSEQSAAAPIVALAILRICDRYASSSPNIRSPFAMATTRIAAVTFTRGRLLLFASSEIAGVASGTTQSAGSRPHMLSGRDSAGQPVSLLLLRSFGTHASAAVLARRERFSTDLLNWFILPTSDQLDRDLRRPCEHRVTSHFSGTTAECDGFIALPLLAIAMRVDARPLVRSHSAKIVAVVER